MGREDEDESTHLSRGILNWFQEHRIIRWLVLLPMGYVVLQIVLELSATLLRFSFGRLVFIQNDLSVATHPLPVGFSLNLLYFLWLVTLLAGVSRIASLRQRIERLENR